MIKGLYFKLNLDRPKDRAIYEFFKRESATYGAKKIEILYDIIKYEYERTAQDSNTIK